MKILSYLVEESPVSDLHTHFYINVERTTFISFLGVTLILSMNMNILDIIITKQSDIMIKITTYGSISYVNKFKEIKPPFIVS